ncbi:MAG: 30S ribosome-binding factor RbfA [Patescibacteria group bacterium]
MASKRIAQVNELLRVELGTLLAREIEFPANCLVTVSKVDTSVDLEHAKIWIKVYPPEQAKTVLHKLIIHIADIQSQLNHRLVMRFVPKIAWKLDISEDRADRIERLLDQIQKGHG